MSVLILIGLIFNSLCILYILNIKKSYKSGVIPDKDIRKNCKYKNMISPFNEGSKGISSGISSYGYDAILYKKIFLFHEENNKDIILDPKNFNKESYTEIDSTSHFILPPHSFALGRTKEYFKIPEDVMVICLGKSTYARCGLVVNVTPLEPGWEGYVTLELSNTTHYPIKVYVNEGICQFLFFKSYEKCEKSYKDKNGKYMKQNDIILAKE